VVLAALVVTTKRRRTAALQERFGPEYQRTVSTAGEKRAAEAELEERQERHEQFQLQPLAPAAQQRYQEDWRMVQSQFVDDPASAVAAADTLIQTVMRERGYPVEDFDRRADDLSVEHPDVVDNYRQGHRLAEASRTPDKSATEDLRRAMRHYRALFDDLVGPSRDDSRTVASRDGRPDAYHEVDDFDDQVPSSSRGRRTVR
jgi:CHAT domain-containing protein